MFLPVGDTPNPRGVPWVTYILMGANILVFLFVSLPLNAAPPPLDDPLLLDYLRAMGVQGAISAQALLDNLTAYDLFVFRYGYRPADPSVTALFSSMFLHGGWMHLAGNMLFLWIFADNVEHRLGRLRFLFAYLATGAAATLFFALFVPHSQVPLVGASGAISGVLGFYYLWFPRNRVKTFIFLFPFIMNTYLIPARYVLGFYLVVDNLIPFLVNGASGSGVAHGAHIGGFLAGLGVAWGVDLLSAVRGEKSVWVGGSSGGKGDAKGEKGAGSFDERLKEGDLPAAADLYMRMKRDERRSVASVDLVRFADALLNGGAVDGALTVFRQFIAERPADPLLGRACLGAGKAMLRLPRQIVAAYHYFLEALDVTEEEEVVEEARMHIRGIERLGEKGRRDARI